MEERIRKAVGETLTKLGAGDVAFVVERPADMAHGDYATNAALAAAKALGKKPREIADTLACALIDALGEDVASHVTVAGTGFVNITLTREAVTRALFQEEKKINGHTRVSVEYGNPNPFKEMHIGHLMSTVIGEAVSRLIEASLGAPVVRDTFGGDVGPHVAKALWTLRKNGVKEPKTAREIGEAYTTGAQAYETSLEAKKEIDALNQAIYVGTDHELMELWRKGRNVSMKEFKRIWKILGTEFDFEFFDSDTIKIGMEKVNEGLAKGVFERGDGDAIIYNGEKKGLHTLVFVTGRGIPTYETKDIGLAFLKQQKIKTDRDLIVTAVEQVGHFKVVLSALGEIDPHLAGKTKHIPHGLLRLSEGKMSSRKGNVITAAALIEEMTKRAGEKNPDPHVAEQVAVGAIKYMILRQAPGSDIIFDLEKSLSLTGDSGPYLQYSLVRAESVLEKAKGTQPSAQQSQVVSILPIEKIILHIPATVRRAARELAPNLLVTHLTQLASEWNAFYAKERIIGGEHEAHYLSIARKFVQYMKNGLKQLGIPTPEKM